jgi:hypothetical protein
MIDARSNHGGGAQRGGRIEGGRKMSTSLPHLVLQCALTYENANIVFVNSLL